MDIEKFTYTPLAIKVYFGNGRFSEIGDIVSGLHLDRVLVLSTDSNRAKALAEQAGRQLGNRLAGYFDECVEQVPQENAKAVQDIANEVEADGVLCVGGGSTIGHGKAVALKRNVKLIHVVTTYSGSEMTISQGFQEGGLKRHVHDTRMRADCVIYDPELTLNLPPQISAPSGMNALAHCVEALYGAHANPISNLLAKSGVEALAQALPIVVATPDDLSARGSALYGAYMSGLSLSAGMALHHHVAHVLGGSFKIPHAIAHSVALPHTIAYNRRAVPKAMDQLCAAMQCDDGPTGLFDLASKLGINMKLQEHGFNAEMVEKAIALIIDQPRDNPRPLEQDAMKTMFMNMVNGSTPAMD